VSELSKIYFPSIKDNYFETSFIPPVGDGKTGAATNKNKKFWEELIAYFP
jgi:hypothetical protein